MTNHYLDLTDIATQAGIKPTTARQYHKRATANRNVGNPRPGDLPEPDVTVGRRPQARKPGWTQAAITNWLTSRPRAGK